MKKLPLDKIVCVGKNYVEHARELGDAIPEKPVLFLKPPSVLKQCEQWGETVQVKFPENRGELHHEIELVVRINEQQKIDAVTVGLDMTLRTEQTRLKKNGHPWTVGKVFVDSAIIGSWIPLAEMPDYLTTKFSLVVDGELRQQGQGTAMTMQPNELLSYISHYFPLCAGDIIFTGTPAGVGPVQENSLAELKLGKNQFTVQWN